MVNCLPAMWETWVRSLGWEDPLEKEMATHSSTRASKFHGWRSLVGYSPWSHKELDMTEQLHFLLLKRVLRHVILFAFLKKKNVILNMELSDCFCYLCSLSCDINFSFSLFSLPFSIFRVC